MVPSSRAFPLSIALLATGALGIATLTPLAIADDPPPGPNSSAPDSPSVHSSDGRPGRIAPRSTADERSRARDTDITTRRLGDGVIVTDWTRVYPRGKVRTHLVRLDLDRPGVRLDLLAPATIHARLPVARMTRAVKALGAARAVAGVNADFFDIGDTGAPLGVGADDGWGLHGSAGDWNKAFTIGADGVPRIGWVPMVATSPGRPGLKITNLNSPAVRGDSIGIYTPRWGRTLGRAVTDSSPAGEVREVLVRGGYVRYNRRTLSKGTTIRGRLLIGRGEGARALSRLRVGQRLRLEHGLGGRPRVAVGGSKVLLRDGKVMVTDNRELHPRTVVGIDRDTNQVLLLVMDGRSESSSGATFVELAELMRERGAEDALNLDGGGSSTLATRQDDGSIAVANDPSDGHQRPVPNGLVVRARP